MEETKNKIKEHESNWERLIEPIETKDSCSRPQLFGLSLEDDMMMKKASERWEQLEFL